MSNNIRGWRLTATTTTPPPTTTTTTTTTTADPPPPRPLSDVVMPTNTANNVGINPNNIIGHQITPIFDFYLLNSDFSNATESYVIDDFTIFNRYIHNNLNIFRIS
jgi:hypothetical protein